MVLSYDIVKENVQRIWAVGLYRVKGYGASSLSNPMTREKDPSPRVKRAPRKTRAQKGKRGSFFFFFLVIASPIFLSPTICSKIQILKFKPELTNEKTLKLFPQFLSKP